MAKRKATDADLDPTPSKKQAVDRNGSNTSKSSFREGLFDQETIDEQRQQYALSEP